MKETSPSPQAHRDGASQGQRAPAALDPDSVRVDERSLRDVLAYAQRFARELVWVDAAEAAGGAVSDWCGFLAGDLDEMVAFLENPEHFGADSSIRARCSRPHFALFLTFVQLLQEARGRLNGFTRRHLEFYFRDALRMTPKAAEPDQVHVIVNLAPDQELFLLPGGSELHAGEDALGQELVYCTERDLLLSRARVAAVRSLFVDREVVGLREVYEDPERLLATLPREPFWATLPDAQRSFLALLDMALGAAGPGTAMAHDVRAWGAQPPPAGADPFVNHDAFLGFFESKLFMPIPVFRMLMQLRRKLASPETAASWEGVIAILERAGSAVRGESWQFKRGARFRLEDFATNLAKALELGGAAGLVELFEGQPGIVDVFDLHRELLAHSTTDDAVRQELVRFIKDELHLGEEEFSTMMRLVEDISRDWRRVYDILRAAGRRKRREHPDHPVASIDPRAFFEDKFEHLVSGTLAVEFPTTAGAEIADLDACLRLIEELESTFFMSAESLALMRSVARVAQDGDVRRWQRERLYELLKGAHAKQYLDRELPLRRQRLAAEYAGATGSPARKLQTMVRFALGHPDPGDPLCGDRDFMELDPDSSEDARYIREELRLEVANFRFVRAVASNPDATPAQWDGVFARIERAWRRKRGLNVPEARIERWSDVFAAEAARSVAVQLGVEGDDTPRWRLFGDRPQPGVEAGLESGAIGFAVVSPTLALAEGVRTITLTIGLDGDELDVVGVNAALAAQPFRVLVTTADGLLDVTPTAPRIVTSERAVVAHVLPASVGPEDLRLGAVEAPFLRLTVRLNAAAAPIASPAGSEGSAPEPPMLQVLLRPFRDTGAESSPYPVLRRLAVREVRLDVDVDGLTGLVLQNDDSELDAQKPFEPFGVAPRTGSGFCFAHPELCSQAMDELRLRVAWAGVPDLATNYVGYTLLDEDPLTSEPASPIADQAEFEAALVLHDRRADHAIGAVQLFGTGASENGVLNAAIDVDLAGAEAAPRRFMAATAGDAARDWSRYWRLTLGSPDFMHALYPLAASRWLLRVGGADTPVPRPFVVAPPYTPTIQRLAVGYRAHADIDLAGASHDRMMHIEPFGSRPLAAAADGYRGLLPQFDYAGALYVGLSDVSAPQPIALLFQLAEGTADPELPHDDIEWRFLDGSDWRLLDSDAIRSDSTNGFANSGIVELDLPAAEPGYLRPEQFYWLRITVRNHTRSVCDVVEIRAQAVVASLASRDAAPTHFEQPLAPDSIDDLAVPMPEVDGVEQPFSSAGGSGPEKSERFYIRVSERLRHKNRAVTSWDYEHMILEAFPEVYRVKCLPVGTAEDPRMADRVQVIVVPDIRGRIPFDPFEPKVPTDMLRAIESYLARHGSPLARFTVRNPRFVELEVRLAVRLLPGADSRCGVERIDKALRRYLSPWAYDDSAEVFFGGRINANMIVDFVENEPHVDYVAGIKLFVNREGAPMRLPADTDRLTELFDDSADVIVVSARKHGIDLIADEGYEEEFYSGINYMKVELDFQIAEDQTPRQSSAGAQP